MRCFNLCPESLGAKTGQFASLLAERWEGIDWEGKGIPHRLFTRDRQNISKVTTQAKRRQV